MSQNSEREQEQVEDQHLLNQKRRREEREEYYREKAIILFRRNAFKYCVDKFKVLFGEEIKFDYPTEELIFELDREKNEEILKKPIGILLIKYSEKTQKEGLTSTINGNAFALMIDKNLESASKIMELMRKPFEELLEEYVHDEQFFEDLFETVPKDLERVYYKLGKEKLISD